MVDADQARPMLEQLRSIANDEFGKDAKSANMPFKVDEETRRLSSRSKPWSPNSSTRLASSSPKRPCRLSSAARRSSVLVRLAPVVGRSGLSLALNAVQIVDLAEQTGGVQFEPRKMAASTSKL